MPWEGYRRIIIAGEINKMESNSKRAGLVPFICTQCCAHLERDPESENFICGYCGTKFHFAKEASSYNIQSATVEHVGSVNITQKSTLESVLNFVENQQKTKAEEERRKREEQRRIEEEDSKKKFAFLRKNWPMLAICLMGIISFTMLFTMDSPPKDESTDSIRVNTSSEDLEGKNYEDVIANLKNAGFTNIQTEVMDDLITGWLTNDGEVEQVEIDGNKDFSSDSRYKSDVEIIVTYHTFPGSESEETGASASSESIVSAAAENTSNSESSAKPIATEEAAITETTAKIIQETTDAELATEFQDELAAVLAAKDPDDPSIQEFADKYEGRTIEFDGYIAAMNLHGDYKTRYDILILAGDYSETTAVGPNFQFRDVSVILDLNLTGSNIPDTIGVGDNLHITAKIGEYEDSSGLFLLEPVSVEFR